MADEKVWTVEDTRKLLRGAEATAPAMPPLPPDAVSATIETVQTVEQPEADTAGGFPPVKRKANG